jgi:hypothetical protein
MSQRKNFSGKNTVIDRLVEEEIQIKNQQMQLVWSQTYDKLLKESTWLATRGCAR